MRNFFLPPERGHYALAGPRNTSRGAALSRITLHSVNESKRERGKKKRNRVPDRSLRRSIVGEAIKGTLIVASDEQWRHRNYRYTLDAARHAAPWCPLDTLSLSFSSSFSLLLSWCTGTRVVHARVLVCTLVKHDGTGRREDFTRCYARTCVHALNSLGAL